MKKKTTHMDNKEQKTDVYLRKKMMEAADDLEKKLEANASLRNVHLTDAMREDILRRIENLDSNTISFEEWKHTHAKGDKKQKGTYAERDAKQKVTYAECGTKQKGTYVKGDVKQKGAYAKRDAKQKTTYAERDDAQDGDGVNVLHFLTEEDLRALEIGKRALRLKKHRKVLQAAVGTAALVLGIGAISMSSEANRLWWENLWDRLIGKETVSYLENTEEKEEYMARIREVCAEIKQQTDINAAYFVYLPEELIFDNYMVNEKAGTATIFYLYQNDTVLSVRMTTKGERFMMGRTMDGDITETISVDTPYEVVKVQTQETLEGDMHHSAEFLKDNCQYSIDGILPQKEFIRLLENIVIY